MMDCLGHGTQINPFLSKLLWGKMFLIIATESKPRHQLCDGLKARWSSSIQNNYFQFHLRNKVTKETLSCPLCMAEQRLTDEEMVDNDAHWTEENSFRKFTYTFHIADRLNHPCFCSPTSVNL